MHHTQYLSQSIRLSKKSAKQGPSRCLATAGAPSLHGLLHKELMRALLQTNLYFRMQMQKFEIVIIYKRDKLTKKTAKLRN